MQYMIIERYRSGKIKDIYKRFDEKGRMIPEGVAFLGSWINEEVTICYQVMETDSVDKLHEWISHWNDLVDFEIIPVINSARARAKVFSE